MRYTDRHDPGAFSGWVHGLAHRLTGDPEVARDAAQDALLEFLRRAPDPPVAARAWLRAVVRNKILGHHRSVRRRRAREESAIGRREGDDEDPAVRRERVRMVVTAMAELDEPYRETLRLAYYEGLSVADVARRAQIPYETARSRLRGAHKRLRVVLVRKHGGAECAWGLLVFGSPTGLSDDVRAADRTVRSGARLGRIAALLGVVIVGMFAILSIPAPQRRTPSGGAEIHEATPTRRHRAGRTERRRPVREESAAVSRPTKSEKRSALSVVQGVGTRRVAFSGRVLHPDGHLLEAAFATLLHLDGTGEWVGFPRVRIDRAGAFRFRDVPSETVRDKIRVEVEADGFDSITYVIPAIELAGGRCVIELARRTWLTGRLVDEFGSPSVGVRLSAWRGPRQESSVTSGVDGSFRLAWVSNVQLMSLRATPPDSPFQDLAVTTVGGTNNDLGDLVLLTSGVVTGKLFGPMGRPAPGVTVSAYRTGGATLGRHVVTDAEGRFHIDVVQGVPYDVEAWWSCEGDDGGFVGARTRVVLPCRDVVELVARPVGSVELDVREAGSGEPVRHPRLRYYLLTQGADRSGLTLREELKRGGVCRYVESGERVLVPFVHGGVYDLVVSTPEHCLKWLPSVEVYGTGRQVVRVDVVPKDTR